MTQRLTPYVLAAAAIVATSATVRAQVTLQLGASATAIEQGDAVQVQLSANGAENSTNPRLKAPSGFIVVGPSVGTSQQVSVSSRGIERTVTTTANWRISATTLGEYVVGPASVIVDGKPLQSNTFTLRVVPKGSLPKKARRRQPSMFDDDFFQNFMRPGRSLFNDLLEQEEPQAQPEIPEEFKSEAASDPYAFLKATLSPAGSAPTADGTPEISAVVGEQVSLRIYAYGALGRYGEMNSHEPRRPDFYSISMLDPNQRFYPLNIGERTYLVTKIREIALFPMKAGKLEIGPMNMTFYGARYASQSHPSGLERETKSLFVNVREPPLEGRPTSYQLGNVGSYSLSANVSERKVNASGSVVVQATLSGIGNVPNRLSTPDQRDVEWSEPTVRDDIKPNEARQIAGSRSFTFLVKFLKPGHYNLGSLGVDSYDPNDGNYHTAKAELGDVDVTSAPQSDVAATRDTDQAEPSLIANLEPAQSLQGPPEHNRQLTDQRWYWWLLAAFPGLSFAADWSSRRLRSLADGRAQRAQTPTALAEKSLNEAARALKQGETSQCIAQLERALFAALEAASGVAARGVLRAELRERLVATGLTSDLAERSSELLARIEDARFAGGIEAPTQLFSDVKSAVQRLLDGPKRSAKSAA